MNKILCYERTSRECSCRLAPTAPSNFAECSEMRRQPALCCGEAIDPLHDRSVEPVTGLRRSDSCPDEKMSQYDRVVIGFRDHDVRHCRPDWGSA
jgi:hypothetical protein